MEQEFVEQTSKSRGRKDPMHLDVLSMAKGVKEIGVSGRSSLSLPILSLCSVYGGDNSDRPPMDYSLLSTGC